MTDRKDSYRLGLAAETLAATGLRLCGYRILARRYKTPLGEIDIVARRGDMLIFVEVKARRSLAEALESVTPRMRQRITGAARHFLARHSDLSGCALRFDVIALAPPFYWRHLDNAFIPPA